MTRRTNALLREYVSLIAWSHDAGHMSTYAAACRLAADGVPIRTALRTLSRMSA